MPVALYYETAGEAVNAHLDRWNFRGELGGIDVPEQTITFPLPTRGTALTGTFAEAFATAQNNLDATFNMAAVPRISRNADFRGTDLDIPTRLARFGAALSLQRGENIAIGTQTVDGRQNLANASPLTRPYTGAYLARLGLSMATTLGSMSGPARGSRFWFENNPKRASLLAGLESGEILEQERAFFRSRSDFSIECIQVLAAAAVNEDKPPVGRTHNLQLTLDQDLERRVMRVGIALGEVTYPIEGEGDRLFVPSEGRQIQFADPSKIDPVMTLHEFAQPILDRHGLRPTTIPSRALAAITR